MNKRTLFTLITVLLLAGISACIIFIYYIPYQKEYALYKGTFMPKQKMQDDFDYVWDFVENGYPFKNVCIRAGADLKTIKEEYLNRLNEPRNEYEYCLFYLGMFNRITGNRQIGHLSIYDPNQTDTKTRKVQNTRIYDTDDEVNRFYEKAVMNMVQSLKQDKLGDLEKKYEVEIPVDKRSFDEANAAMLESRIIEDKAIAYLNIKSFSPYGAHDAYIQNLTGILKSFEGYKHLIIDLRENSGGHSYLWRKYIVAPLIKEPIEYFIRIAYNSKNKFYKILEDNFFEKPFGTKDNIDDSDFANLNKEDRKEFDSCIDYVRTIRPSEERINFQGRAWILIGPDTISSGDQFAYFAKYKNDAYINFATVVGANTGGEGLNLLPNRLYLKLPQSHMLIQSDMGYGFNPDGSCNSETGTSPHIKNLPDKDALETCLAEIHLIESQLKRN